MADDERAIRELVASWMAATEAGQTDKVLSLMADDVVFLVPGQPPMNKGGFARAHAEMRERLGVVSDIKEVQVAGDWAYCWNTLSVTITPDAGGPMSTRAGQVLSILRRQDGCGAGGGVSERRASVHLRGGHHCREASNVGS